MNMCFHYQVNKAKQLHSTLSSILCGIDGHIPDDEVNEILYHAMPNTRKKKMTE